MNGKLKFFFALVFLALFASSRAQSPAPAKTDAQLLTIEGTVEVLAGGTTNWNAGRTNQVLHVGDRVRTAPHSRATLRLSDLTVLRVNELTTLQIRAPQQPGRQSLLDLGSGSTYLFSREKPTEVEFRTPLTSGAIRGTEFNLAVADDGRTIVSVIDGEVDLTNPDGQHVEMTSGEQGIVAAGQAPQKTALLNAINVIQWCLYYPGVLDASELDLTPAEQQTLAASLTAYQSGDLLGAVAQYPAGRTPASDSERVFRAATLIAAGQIEEADVSLGAFPTNAPAVDRPARLATALREMVAVVKNQLEIRPAHPALATEWMAESYYLQAHARLEEALRAARAAVGQSTNFGLGWARVAELEFSFGHISEAMAALERSLALSPRNAQALAVKGFLLAAENKIPEAGAAFEQAIALDGALGNAWLGRALIQVRNSQAVAGRSDLQVAAALEPQRAILRSYLGKAFSNAGDDAHATKELKYSQKLDPNDPTSWLYTALLAQSENRINQAVSDLEKSEDLNDNRRIYRSKLLLDQDRAVRSANLANIYQDAGMFDWSVREATRAVDSDYANYSAHEFLANSYDALRDPKQINLRYETPWFSELLLANLIAPVGAGNLSQYISQQEYSRLFEGDHAGISTDTEYLSTGDFLERASQYGNIGNSSYSVDIEERTENGLRPNNDLHEFTWWTKFKQQVTPADSIFLMVQGYEASMGDEAQYYNQAGASQTERIGENQRPNIFVGWHHEWSPQSHTLILAGHLNDTLTRDDSNDPLLAIGKDDRGTPTAFNVYQQPPFSPTGLAFERDLNAFTIEPQQIFKLPSQTIIFGGRFQTGDSDTLVTESRGGFSFPLFLSGLNDSQDVKSQLRRESVYAYDFWQIFDSLQLSAGVAWDRLTYPENTEIAPIINQELSREQISPKLGFTWRPWKEGYFRGAFTRSLGGVYYDNSVRLEPVQIDGFIQSYRSIAPESVVGLVPGSSFETWGLAFDQRLKSNTYFGITAEVLQSKATRTFGDFDYDSDLALLPAVPSGTPEDLHYRERTLTLAASQLLGEGVSVGVNYRLDEADLQDNFSQIPLGAVNGAAAHQNLKAFLHQVNLYANYNHPSGFFAQFDSVWSQQSNHGYTPDEPGDDFWQFNAWAGWRFYHRAIEAKVGLLDINNRDYQLNPLNYYNELPRRRTFAATFKFYF